MKENAQTANVTAYRKRPLWTVLLAAAFILAPFGNLIMTLVALKVPQWWHPQIWWAWLHGVDPILIGLQVLIMGAGIALLSVRNWSWTAALVVLILVAVYNVFAFKHLLQMGMVAVLAMLAVTICSLVFLLYSPFRQPYLNPRLRWWETSPRFRADIKVVVEGHSDEALLVDVSRTGALIEFRDGEAIPEMSGLKQLTLTHGPILNCSVIRKTEKGYGLKFHKLSSASRRYLKNWLKELAKDPTRFAR